MVSVHQRSLSCTRDVYGERVLVFADINVLGRIAIREGNLGRAKEYRRKFWKSHPEKLDEWSRQVRAGERPEFGANLVY
jgi:hypothetical protein